MKRQWDKSVEWAIAQTHLGRDAEERENEKYLTLLHGKTFSMMPLPENDALSRTQWTNLRVIAPWERTEIEPQKNRRPGALTLRL